MAMPTVTVEVAFTTDPGSAPSWTDISAYLKKFTVHRGRADELAVFNAGQATITLANEDRRFDPNYTSSPYSPNVIPMRRIRIRATYNAVTYDVFNGYVSNWQQIYRPPQDAECVVEATDAFKVLSNIALLSSVYETEVKKDSPTYWWRLNEPSGSTSILDSVSSRALYPFGAPSLGAAGLVAHDPGTALSQADSMSGYADRGSFIAAGNLPSFTLETIVKTTVVGGGAAASFQDIDVGMYITLGLSGTNKGLFQVFTTVAGVGSVWGFQGSTTINDGNPHHLVGTWTVSGASGTAKLYVDGVLEATDSFGTNGPTSRQEMAVGNLASGALGGYHATGLVGTVDEVAFYLGVLSDTRIAAHAAARATPWRDDLSGARVGRLLDAGGWPTADRNVDVGTSVLQSSDLGGNLLSALQAVEQTEFGALFVTAAGLVRFIGRDSLLKTPYTTSQGTFGDTGSDLEYGDLTYEYDDELIVNEAQVSRSDGTVQIATDTTSQTKYLRRTRVVSGLLHQSDSTSRDAANWIVNHYKDPILRLTGLRLEPAAGNETTHFPQVLGRELMDRVTVKRIPQNLGAAISQDAQIQGISHTATSMEWVTQWNLSPAETQIYWILGTAGYSELDQTTRLAF